MAGEAVIWIWAGSPLSDGKAAKHVPPGLPLTDSQPRNRKRACQCLTSVDEIGCLTFEAFLRGVLSADRSGATPICTLSDAAV